MSTNLIGIIADVGSTIFGVFKDKKEAEKLYRYIVPELQSALSSGSTMSTPAVKKAIEILQDLPPAGARRRNFRYRYLYDRPSLMNLPVDPDRLSIGYWW